MRHIVLFGAGGHGKVVRDIVEKMHDYDLESCVVAVYDDFVLEKMLDGTLPILNSEAAFHTFVEKNGDVYGLIGISGNAIRERLSREYPMKYAVAIHPTAIIAEDVQIGEGTVVMAGAIINPGSRIGRHCIINTGAIIEHDCKIEDFVHISPGVKLAGDVRVGRMTHVGIGASVIQKIKIGQDTIIGAGAVVIRDIPDNVTAVGVPAKVIVKHKTGR